MQGGTEQQVVEQIGVALGNGLEKVLGSPVELGRISAYDDHEVLSRAVPLRVVMATFATGLSDSLVVISNMRNEQVSAAISSAALELAAQLQVPATLTEPSLHEFETRDEALEELQALFDEPSLHYTTPVGEMLVVVGSGLVQSTISKLRGSTASFDIAEPATADAATSTQAVPAMAPAGTPNSVAPVQAAAASAVPAADEEVATPAAVSEPEVVAVPVVRPGIPANPTVADAQMHVPAAQMGIDPEPQSAYANSEAAEAGRSWQTLLSGVDVQVSAELGRTEIRMGELTSLTRDSVLTLEQHVEEPVVVYVNGAAYAHARLVDVDGEYGVEILEVFGAGVPTADTLHV